MSDADNLTTYVTAFEVDFFIPIRNSYEYLAAVIYQLPISPLISFILYADVCLLFVFVAHISGQFATLCNCVIPRISCENDTLHFQHIKLIIRRHRTLIRYNWSWILYNCFNLRIIFILNILFLVCRRKWKLLTKFYSFIIFVWSYSPFVFAHLWRLQ